MSVRVSSETSYIEVSSSDLPQVNSIENHVSSSEFEARQRLRISIENHVSSSEFEARQRLRISIENPFSIHFSSFLGKTLELTNNADMKVYYVYILKCVDGTYYTGITSNLSKRIEEHSVGKYPESYTYSRRPLELSFYAKFTNPLIAIVTEKQIKKWSQAKKEALINNEYTKLPNLAKKYF